LEEQITIGKSSHDPREQAGEAGGSSTQQDLVATSGQVEDRTNLGRGPSPTRHAGARFAKA
jgi:hypothetical protein